MTRDSQRTAPPFSLFLLRSLPPQIAMKLLTDLNRREGVTMVMVTHDQSMKAYAHRCVPAPPTPAGAQQQ